MVLFLRILSNNEEFWRKVHRKFLVKGGTYLSMGGSIFLEWGRTDSDGGRIAPSRDMVPPQPPHVWQPWGAAEYGQPIVAGSVNQQISQIFKLSQRAEQSKCMYIHCISRGGIMMGRGAQWALRHGEVILKLQI